MKLLKIGLCILALLAGDWLTKRAFYDLKRGQELRIFEPIFNTGISRGIGVYLPIVIGISFVGIGLFFWLWRNKQFTDLIFVLFLAGTIGNLGDRVFLGGVRDFISIGSFPVFNLADCFLTLAVVILLRKEIFPCNREKKH